MFIKYNQKLKTISRNLRKNQTASEIIFRKFLKKNFSEYRFLNQKPLDNFIVDFYCPKLNLVIEIDGGVHLSLLERDRERDNILLLKYGLFTLRFTNLETNDPDFLLREINSYILKFKSRG